MQTREILADAHARIRDIVRRAVADLDRDGLAFRPDAEANSIAWLVWHLTRIQDDHVSELAGRQQVWIEDGWHARFGMPADPSDTGYGHTSAEVAALRPDGPDVLLDYYDAVAERTAAYIDGVDADELARVIDRSYDPPVTAGVRLVSVLSDDLQHAGQAAYVRGIVGPQALTAQPPACGS